MAYRSLLVTAACIGAACAGSVALAVPAANRTTTDSCLAKGLCAYVSPTGRVTCGRCPGQAHAMNVPARATAVCKDGTFSLLRTARPRRMCVGRGGVGVLLAR